MGVFRRSVHIFRKTGGIDVNQSILDFYARMGVVAKTFGYSDQVQQPDRGVETSNLAFIYNPSGEWFSFYPDREFTDEHVAQLMDVVAGSGIYLFVYDSDDWGFHVFDSGKIIFKWVRLIEEPLSISKGEILETQDIFARLFEKQISYDELQNLLGTDVLFSEEKIARLGKLLNIPGANIGVPDIIAGEISDVDQSKITSIQLEYPQVEPKHTGYYPSQEAPSVRQRDITADAFDVLFFARWPRQRNSSFRFGYYVIDAIALIRDLLVGAEWSGRTVVEFSPGVEDRLESTRRRLRLAKSRGIIRENELMDFADEQWEDIVLANPFTEEDLFIISQHIDRGEVVLFFADLDEVGSFVRFTVQDNQPFLLINLAELFYIGQTINDIEIYERFFSYELSSIIDTLFVKTQSEYGCISVVKETDWSDEIILDVLNVWPPKGHFINYLGPDIVKPVKLLLQKRFNLSGGYDISKTSSGGLIIKIPYQPNEIISREFQESIAKLSEIFAEVLG